MYPVLSDLYKQGKTNAIEAIFLYPLNALMEDQKKRLSEYCQATGLHFADVKKLLEVLEKLVENGNSVILIEHNLDVIKTADYIIDLGPDGGDDGGTVVACGTPEEVARVPGSFTGEYLRRYL